MVVKIHCRAKIDLTFIVWSLFEFLASAFWCTSHVMFCNNVTRTLNKITKDESKHRVIYCDHGNRKTSSYFFVESTYYCHDLFSLTCLISVPHTMNVIIKLRNVLFSNRIVLKAMLIKCVIFPVLSKSKNQHAVKFFILLCINFVSLQMQTAISSGFWFKNNNTTNFIKLFWALRCSI